MVFQKNKLLEKADFGCLLTGQAMVLPASFDKWKASSTKSEIRQFHVLVVK